MVGYNPSDSLFDSIFVLRRDVPLLCAKRSLQASESPIYFTISDAVVNLISFVVRKRFLLRKKVR